MNKKVLKGLLTIAMTLTLGGSAFPQNVELSATIPFDFYVGAERMNSGNYSVQRLSDAALVISSADNHHRVTILSNAAFRPLNAKGSELVFNHYAGGYFLSQVAWQGGAARSLAPTRREIEAAKNISGPKTVEISLK